MPATSTPNNCASVSRNCGDAKESSLNHPIARALRDFHPAQEVDVDALNYVVTVLSAYTIEHLIFRSSSYRETLDFVYGLNDDQLYTVVSAPHDDHYDFFVIHSDYFHPRSANHMHFREIRYSSVDFLKNLNRYEGQQLGMNLKSMGEALKDMKKSLTYTARRAIGVTEEQEVVYPHFDRLKSFYECERKVRYDSVEDGLRSCEDWNKVYRCEHCSHYHQGRPRQVTPEDNDSAKVLQRYQVTWKRYQSTGRLNKVTTRNSHDA